MHRLPRLPHCALVILSCLALAPCASAAPETYYEWVARLQVPEAKRGLNDDPAGDGTSNLLKYALGINPLTSATNLLPKAETTSIGGTDRLVLTVGKNPDAMGVTYIVESSSDLSGWSSAGLSVLSETGTTLKVADSVALGQNDHRFMRVRVTLSDPLSGAVTWQNVTAIHGVLDNAISAYQIPGILYSVKVAGKDAWAEGRGVRDTATKAALSGGDRFRIGSASKTFVGMAVLKLIQQQRMGFENSISAYLPAAVLSKYDKNHITIRMLLQHTSGINNYTNIIEDWFIPYITDRKRVWTTEELVELVNSRFALSYEEGGKVADPGQKWYYSNTNTLLLAMAVEKVVGMPIRQYITEQFIQPLGLTDTLYPAPGESTIPGNYAKGYVDWANFTGEPSMPSGLTDVTVYDPTGVGAAGPMISSARDLAVWMEAIVKNDQLIGDYRSGHIDWHYFTSFSNATGTPRPGSYGMKLAHEPDVTNNADYYIIGHRGQISGYDTAMMYIPEKNVALVVVCNRTLRFAEGAPDNALLVAMNQIIAILYPDLIAANKLPPKAAALRIEPPQPAAPFKRKAALTEY